MAKRRKFSNSERSAVAQRARGLCEYCQVPEGFSPDTFEMEHIIALVHGGTNELDNIAFSCGGCNQFKGAKLAAVDPETQVTTRLFNPRRDLWHDHFRWGAPSSAFVVGISDMGRATVACLQFNRNGCVNLRVALALVGVHPPVGQ
jgi:hypothetical protein